MQHRSARLRAAVAAMLLAAIPAAVCAADPASAEPYPSRPLTIVVPSVAGNVNDAVARLIGQELTRSWGQPVIVDNKPGAGTTTGTKYVARAAKDGYTALLTFTAHVQNPSLYRGIGYDPIADFTPVSEVAISSTILAVSPDFPARTLPEVVALLKANPGKYPYGSYGAGTTGHILGELLKREAGLQMEHVAYKGGAPLATDLAAGHVKLGFIAVGTAMPLLQGGKLAPVAIAGAERSALLPKVPTFREAGYKGFEPDAWMGLLFPAGVPKARVDALSREVARIVRLPEIAKKMQDLNLVPVGSTPEAFATVMKNDRDKWSRIISDVGITLE
ncbi:Tripartite-type tricarboxylate transporter, extracytoplasmic receptor component TctC [Cupriavidus necator]|uniref:Probable extra-cytoplasmic solute receptor n=1 Tax=Cupriavidus necator (strain ATCC 17699 / DSM 428 / KCTC 22496 / NCIMB 10442 / H16 / Stanier 337) TaxID=381666 RepID=Q0K9Z2_CUPNH|nr:MULTISPECIES: tripartite tricarboxylate transporter substrate binding protein [Cupriavidus]EON16624.1 extra-cytoplasmic solute receptor [Cupriavidus sp. GA3-3]QCC01003.1 tripartite tricarboxylate transporter substrate binding protein [Cupriavidus necator H16]QQB76170.1 tripartite tricarboxylate transporter substrate binding protein [Cupriavidus necator]WKA39373.1 tripartite tricarboxylate transporter substrate binding protein [Cupriavidus necator]CAJ93179.1 probable extra-cytoplasmic solute